MYYVIPYFHQTTPRGVFLSMYHQRGGVLEGEVVLEGGLVFFNLYFSEVFAKILRNVRSKGNKIRQCLIIL